MDITEGGTVVIGYTYRRLVNAAAGSYVEYDPAVPTVRILPPKETASTPYTFPASPQVAHVINGVTTVGYYELTIRCDVVGSWQWGWVDPDITKPDATYGSFRVIAAPFV